MLAHRTSFVILALFLFVSPAPAKDVAAIASVSWTPRQLESGSVCLFTVTPTADATALNGKWMGHNISFVKARDRNVWYALAGIDVEARPGSYPVEVRASWPDGSTVTVDRRVQVLTARYKTEKLRVPTNYVEPDAATLQIIAADRKIKEEAFARQSPRAAWSGDFLPPVKTTMSEAFGTRRTFNGKLASIHRGLDYHAKPGTPVLASNSGKVLLARGLFYEGNCVVIDHGQGFVTFYMHLSTIEVVEGQTVSKGELIGQSGATGRVTGPHLHMAARWEGAYVDPAKLFQLPLPTVP